MKLTFHRSGGFGNIQVDAAVDSLNLSQEFADRLAQLTQKVLPFPALASSPPFPDMHTYDLTIEENGADPQSLHLTDADLTDDLQELFNFLLDLA